MELLAVGEGNFSFIVSLAGLLNEYEKRKKLPPQAVPFVLGKPKGEAAWPERVTLVGTSFDSHEDLLEKYPESIRILDRASKLGKLTVQHGINAWDLETQFPGRRFDAVIWNHPHLGVEDFRLHKFLMSHFFHSASCVLKGREEKEQQEEAASEDKEWRIAKAVDVEEEADGHVCMSLVVGQFERWSVEPQAIRHGFELIGRFPFEHSDFPLYESRRNHSGQSFQNVHTQKHHGHEMVSITYVLRRRRRLRTSALPRSIVEQKEGGCRQPQQPDTARLGGAAASADAKPCAEVFPCPECHMTFKTKQGARGHHHQVHVLQKYGGGWRPAMPKVLKCFEPTCERKFHDEEAREQHHISRHGADPDITHALSPLDCGPIDAAAFYGCPVCTQAIPSGWGVEQHLEMLKPCLRLKAKCELCAKQFSELRAMRQHRNFCKVNVSGR